MGSNNGNAYATIRYVVPDNSVTAEQRSLYAFPANKEVVEEHLELHNFRTATELVKGAEGLDVQGFTYINHRSALSNSDQWFTGRNVEETYIPETEDLICQLTGAKKAVVSNIGFRRKIAEEQADHTYVSKRGDKLDQDLAKLSSDVALVMGKQVDESLEPARLVHIDYTMQALRDSARYCRTDIKAAAQNALDAEDAKSKDVPRYAAYSVWRPIKAVKRDPLASCDWRTINKETDLCSISYRTKSNVNSNGEYLLDAWIILPPQKPIKHKWYWMPEQKPDEVLIVKLADTAADGNPDIAPGCPHASPEVDGTTEEEPRNSIECRVLAFW